VCELTGSYVTVIYHYVINMEKYAWNCDGPRQQRLRTELIHVLSVLSEVTGQHMQFFVSQTSEHCLSKCEVGFAVRDLSNTVLLQHPITHHGSCSIF
jgi:hypothetical protein